MADVRVHWKDMKYGGIRYYNYKGKGNIYLVTININADIHVGDTVTFPDQGTPSLWFNGTTEGNINVPLNSMNSVVQAIPPSLGGIMAGKIYAFYPKFLSETPPESGSRQLENDGYFETVITYAGELLVRPDISIKGLKDSVDIYHTVPLEELHNIQKTIGSIEANQSSLIISAWYVPSLKQFIRFDSGEGGDTGYGGDCACICLDTKFGLGSSSVSPNGRMGIVTVKANYEVPFYNLFQGARFYTVQNASEWVQHVYENSNESEVTPTKPSKDDDGDSDGKGSNEPFSGMPTGEDIQGGGDGDYVYPDDKINIPEGLDITFNHLGTAGVWNPTVGQLKEVFNKLWDTSILKAIKEVVGNDFMKCIIGVKAYPLNLTSTEHATLAFGTVSSGVDVNICSHEKVKVRYETTGRHPSNTFLDYSPYASARLYLPYVGFVDLDIDEIAKNKIVVQYTISLTTGATCIWIKVGDNIRYNYNTYMGADVPLSSTDNQSLVRFLGSTVTGAAATVTGLGVVKAGEMGKTILGQGIASGASGVLMGNNVQHSSPNASGWSGMYGVVAPFIVYKYPRAVHNDAYSASIGLLSETPYKLYKCKAGVAKDGTKESGFVKVRAINLSVAGANRTEMNLIESKLKGGVII